MRMINWNRSLHNAVVPQTSGCAPAVEINLAVLGKIFTIGVDFTKQYDNGLRRPALGIAALLLVTLSACLPVPTPEPTQTAPAPYRITQDENPYAPDIEDTGRQVAAVTVTSVIVSEKYEFTPPRAAIVITGYMPSVCNELRIEISPPDDQFRVFIEAYSLIDPDIHCDDVFQQFEAEILLGTYSTGRFTIWVNDALAGDFVSY